MFILLKMFNIKLIGFFAFTLLVVCKSAFVDNLNKCGLNDEECGKKLLNKIFNIIGENGIPEYGLSPIDPFFVKFLPVSLFGIMDFNITDGTVTGIKNCNFEKFTVNSDTKVINTIVVCPVITATGKYDMTSSQLIKNLAGNDVTGNGNGRIEVENLNINIRIPFKIIKRGDDYFFQHTLEETTYNLDILGNIKFEADNIKMGEQDITKMVNDFINQNAKFLATSFYKYFADVAAKLVDEEIKKVLDVMPMNLVIIDDLQPLL